MNKECVQYSMTNFEFFKRYHVCFVYDHSQSIGDEDSVVHSTKMDLYLDGTLVNSG